jgi:hypothetical protein
LEFGIAAGVGKTTKQLLHPSLARGKYLNENTATKF